MLENGVLSGEIGTFLTHSLFEFNSGAKALEMARNICTTYWNNAIREITERKWFSCLEEDRFDISETPR